MARETWPAGGAHDPSSARAFDFVNSYADVARPPNRLRVLARSSTRLQDLSGGIGSVGCSLGAQPPIQMAHAEWRELGSCRLPYQPHSHIRALLSHARR